MKKIDIIIVNFNSTDAAIESIRSIKKNSNSINVNIVIVDNDSIDYPKRLQSIYTEVKVLYNSKNYGYSIAINQALKLCYSPYVVILNPDTVIYNGFFTEIYTFFENNPEIGIVGPEIFDPDGNIQGSARRFPTIWTSFFGRKSPLTRIFPKNSITKKEFFCFNNHSKSVIEVDWVSGACMVIRKKALNIIGGFDQDFFLYWEDADLCKRINDAGWQVVYYRNAKVMHTVGRSSRFKPIVSLCHFHISSFKYFFKHSNSLQKLFIPFVFCGLSARCIIVVALNSFYRLFSYLKSNNKKFNNEFIYQSFQNPKKKEIKVSRFVSRLNIGGPSIHVSILSKYLNKEKFKTYLTYGALSPQEGDMSYLLNDFSSDFVFFRNLPELQREINPLKDIIAFLKIFYILLTEKPNIVHSHTAKAGSLARFSAILINQFKPKKIKIIHTYHGHVLSGYFGKSKSNLFKIIEKILGKFTDRIIAISHTQKWELSDKYKIAPKEKIQIINLGFDLSRFTNKSTKKDNLRKIINAAAVEKIIAIVGRLAPIKNHRMFLDAAKILMNCKIGYKLKFLIVGDGELRVELEKYTNDIGLFDRVVFYGWEKNIEQIYSAIDILALTSLNEGTPVSIIEAMASGVPVITTGVGGVKDLLGRINPNKNNSSGFKECERGILCPVQDANIFANGIEYMLKNKIDRYHPIVKNARDFVLKNYSYTRLVHDIESLYSDLINQ